MVMACVFTKIVLLCLLSQNYCFTYMFLYLSHVVAGNLGYFKNCVLYRDNLFYLRHAATSVKYMVSQAYILQALWFHFRPFLVFFAQYFRRYGWIA